MQENETDEKLRNNAEKNSCKVLEPETSTNFKLRASKRYVPFSRKFPMAMHFVLLFHKRCR